MTSLEKRLLYQFVQDELAFKKWMMMSNKSQAEEETEVVVNCLKELVYLHTIPRNIVYVDEIYIRHCLEMIHISAGNISLQKSCKSENANANISGHWIIGSINESKSMKNILKHKMLSGVGVLEDIKGDSGSHSVICLPHKLNRFDEMSRCSIDVSEQQLSDLGADVSLGTLQRNLTDRGPCYVFSIDEKREVYEASLLSTGSSSDGATQWMYSFNLHNGRQKEGQVVSTKELSHVGTMKVSAHFTTCSNNFKILETEFVLYGLDENMKDESISDPLSQSFRMKKGLSKKVASTFKPSLSIRKRAKSVIWRTSSVTDSCPWSPPTEVHKTSGKQIQPYSEIASVIIRNHVNIPLKEVAAAEPGGWGSSILKRVTQKETSTLETSEMHSKSQCQCNDSNCSATDIIIPAGYHCQPEMGDGSNFPSSLIERWKSGGQCDCGGWDIGCPLTVFTTRQNKTTAFGDLSNQNKCCSFDTVLKGTGGHQPQMKMLNISSDLYYLDFRSSLSALQCFVIAVAILHCNNSALQTQTVQDIPR